MAYRKRTMLATALLAGLLLVAACQPPGDTTAPALSLASPHDGDTLSQGTIIIEALATDDVAMMKVEFYVDGALKGTDSSGIADTFACAWDASSEGIGSQHTIKATARDASDNTTSKTITITIAAGSGGATHHNVDIWADETWSPSGNPHIIDRTIMVAGAGMLTIEPGCIVKFAAGAALYCALGINFDGGIKAVGTADSTILFTSDAATPQKGDWKFVAIGDRTLPATEFSYCTFEYGGGATDSGEVLLWAVNPAKFDHCTIRQSGDYGVVCAGAATGFGTFTNNTVTANDRYPISIYPAKVPAIGAGNVLTGNAQSGVEVVCAANSHFVSATATWANLGVPYVLTGDLFVGEYTSPVLTIAPGCTLKMPAGTTFNVGYYPTAPGGLIADGTGGQIVFTSSLASPAPGNWYGIVFGAGSAALPCSLVNCKVEYGGGDATTRSDIYTYNSTPTITGSTIGYSSTWGIFLDGTAHADSAQLEADNTFLDCAGGHVGHP